MKRGDIYSVDLEPTQGREQQGRRPVMIVSPDAYNRAFAPLICPITAGGGHARHHGFTVPLSGGATTGVVLCNQARTLDVKARGGKRIEAADASVVLAVLYALQDIVAE